MTTQQTTARVVFEAQDKTAAGVASAKASLQSTAKEADKVGKSTSGAFERASKKSQEFGNASKGLEGIWARLSKGASGAGGSIDGMGSRFAQLASRVPGYAKVVVAAAAGIAAAWAGAVELAERVLPAERATARLQVSIDGARDALGGFVDEMSIARIANKGFALGVISSGKDLEKLAGGVRALAEDLGEDPTQLLEDAITGIGRKSSAILDNLGIVLTAEQAEEEYAAQLGKTTAQLTAYEKSQAFTKVAIDRVADAARSSSKANDSLAESVTKARVSLQDFENRLYGFDNVGGRIRETLREMDEETLKLFGSRNQTDIAQINRMLAESGLTYEQIKDYVIDINNIETLRGGQLSREQRLQVEKGLLDLTGEALRHQEKAIANEERLAALAAAEEKAKADADAVALLDHEVAILQAIGASEEEILGAQEAALQIRIEQAEAAGDLAAQVENERKLELLLLGALNKKNKARGRGVSQAEKITAAGERELQLLDEQIKRMGLLGQLRGTEADTAVGLAELEYERRLKALDLEERSLEATRAKNSVERQRKADRLEAIGVERELIALEKANAQREEANRLVEEAVRLSTARTQAEAAAGQRAYEASSLRLDTEAEAIELQADSLLASERNAYRRIEIERDKELQLLALQRKRLAEEKKAEEAALDAREAAVRSESGGSPLEQAQREEEIKQIGHEREMLRLQQQAEARRLLEQEKAAHFQAEQARNAATWQMVNEGLENFQNFQAQLTETANFFTEYRNAAADADHAQTIRAMEERGAAQKAALDREIAAAKGNVQLQNKLRQKQARQDAQLRRQIEVAEAKHQDKRKRQEMRAAGIQMMIVAAVETVKAVAAFASFNYIEGALHVAAAAVAAVKGGMLLSGNIPGGGAEANLPSGGGAGMSAGVDRETVDPSNVPGSVPGQAARRESATAAPQVESRQPTVVINGDVNAWGEITPTVAEDLGRAINDVSRSREM